MLKAFDDGPVFGIDLGTTYSAIAYLDKSGRPTVCCNPYGSETTPSVVYFETPENVVVGETAKQSTVLDTFNVVSLIKRQMGTDWAADYHGEVQTPESISALILRQLATDAAASNGGPVEQVVIAVPTYFGVRERDATRNAGRIAGLDVVGIMPEPVAAAIHYDVTSGGGDKTVLVYDLGGVTFDTTVIEVSAGEVTVVCTDGDTNLGGADWDERLVEHLLARFTELANPAEPPGDDLEFQQEIATKAEELKKRLSQQQARPLQLRFAGASAKVEVSRAEFETMTADLLDRTIEIVERTLARLQDKRPGATIDEVLLVGGSTKMPMVAARLTEKFGWDPKLHDPDLAVAKGAAIFALSRVAYRVQQQAREAAASEGAKRAVDVVQEVARQYGIPADQVDALVKGLTTNEEAQAASERRVIEVESAAEQRRYALLRAYAQQGLSQSRTSFLASLIAATLGFIVILTGAGLSILSNNVVGSTTTVIAGVVIDAVSLLFFSQDRRHQQVMFDFFERLREERKLDEALELIRHSQRTGSLNPDIYAAVILHFANVPDAVDVLRSAKAQRSTTRSRDRNASVPTTQ